MPATSHTRTKRRRLSIAIIVNIVRFLLVCSIVFACWRFLSHDTNQPRVQGPKIVTHTAEAQLRAVYPLSLIPGGVQSDADLEAARAADPILADHYADVGFLRPTFLAQDEMLYASYRQGQSIVWTSSPIRVRAGEAVLSDRSGNLIRGRCGNRLSQTRRSPVAFTEPPPSTFDEPRITFPDESALPDISPDYLAADALPDFPSFEPPQPGTFTLQVPTTAELSEDWASAAPPGMLVPGFVMPGRPGPKPGVPTPEPSSSILVISAAIIAAWLFRKAHTRKRASGRH